MGGDHAPAPEVEGAVAAARRRLAEVVLVGDQARIQEQLRLAGGEQLGIRVSHASEVITMDDSPAMAVKGKKDSSMRRAFDLVKRGEARAVVSAGNSGAMLACGLLVMKRLAGVERPGIVTSFPTRRSPCVLIDMGANVDCRPQHLAQFAILGAVYSRLVHGKSRPRVGLLSNGAESSKGTELTRETDRLLGSGSAKQFDYVGYVEGRDIFGGALDVVVTDGFTGNVVLKTAEGAGAAVVDLLRHEILGSRMGKLGAIFLRNSFRRLKGKIDYDEHGGAPLLGVSGIAIICHGGSSAKALKNGIRLAAELVDVGLPQALGAAVAEQSQLWQDAASAATASTPEGTP